MWSPVEKKKNSPWDIKFSKVYFRNNAPAPYTPLFYNVTLSFWSALVHLQSYLQGGISPAHFIFLTYSAVLFRIPFSLGEKSLLCIFFQSILFLDLACSVSRHSGYWGKLTRNTSYIISSFPGTYSGTKLSSLPLLRAPPICKLSQPNSSRDLKSVRELRLLIYRVEVCTEESSVMGFFAPWRDIT